MANDFTFKDASETTLTAKATDNAGVHIPWGVIGNSAASASAPVDGTAGLKVDLGTDNDIQGAAAENAAVSGNPVLSGGRYDASDRVLGDGDVGAVALTAKGILKVQQTNSTGVQVDPDTTSIKGPGDITVVDSHNTLAVNIAAAGTQTIAAPGADHQIWIKSAALKTNGTTATVQIKEDNAGTPVDKTGVLTLTDSDGFVLPPSGNFEDVWVKCSSNVTCDIVTTGSGTVDGVITYAVVDVS